MKKIYLSLLTVFLSAITFAQVTVTATGGTASATYTTLKAAFDAINSGTHTSVINIVLTASTTETASAILNGSGTGTASYVTINISGGSAAYTVSGSIAGPLLQFNGADSINFNGNNLLTLNNTNTGGQTLSYINDATSIVVRNMTIKGATAANTSGVVFFGAGVTTGNDNNTLDNCSVDGTGTAATCIFSAGLTTSPATENSGDTIRNCKVFDFFSTTVGMIGINLSSGNTGWSIRGNSVYQTINRTAVFQTPLIAIQVFPSYTGDEHEVISNFVGGTGPGATGTWTYTGTGTTVVGFIGINYQAGGVNGGANVSNNTVQNVTSTYSSASGSFSNAGISAFVSFGGYLKISGNTITNVNVTNAAGNTSGSGIAVNARVTTNTSIFPQYDILNNIINNMTYTSGGASGAITAQGIRLESSSAAAATLTTSLVNTVFIVQANTITNLTSSFNGGSVVRGIQTINTQATGANARLWPLVGAYNNIINGLTANSTTASLTSPAVSGIFMAGSTGIGDSTDTHQIFGNTIFNLSNTNTTDVANNVLGVYVNGTAAHVDKNKIYDLRNSAPGLTSQAVIQGISVRNTFDTTIISNNFVSLGHGQTSNTYIAGINNTSSSGRLINVFFNSVSIGGTAATGSTQGSGALVRDTATTTTVTTQFNSRNNLLVNTRTGGSGAHYALILDQSPVANYSSNYNNFYTGTTTPISLAGTAVSLASYQTTTGQDANSKSINVNWVNPTNGDLHLAAGSIGNSQLAGQTLTTANTGLPTTVLTEVNMDFDKTTRPTVNPYIGADEALTPVPIILSNFIANRTGKVNILNWSTAQEINTRKFIVERSINGRDFTSIGEVAAFGNSQSARNYQFTDNSPIVGTNYYRINSVDLDNSARYSLIRSVKNEGLSNIALYPNPAKDNVTLNIDAFQPGLATISVTDMNGAQIMLRTSIVTDGNNLLTLNVSNLAKGTYVIYVRIGSEKLMQKLNKL